MDLKKVENLTPYQDVNEVLLALSKGILNNLGDEVIGIYLFGSLSYEDFKPNRSDIDLAVIIKNLPSSEKLEEIKKFHLDLENKNKKWEKRIECSYTPFYMLKNIIAHDLKRPYFGAGIFYADALYGNEWLINNYLLFKQGLALFGPEFNTLIKPIAIEDVQKACVRDLFKEWEPMINNSEWLKNSHNQSYLVLNLCRILHTVFNGSVGSKTVSASWVKKEYPQWKNLIQEADEWDYNKEMESQAETVKFIKFTIDKVNEINIKLN